MIDLAQYPDDAILSTSEIVTWLKSGGVSAKSILGSRIPRVGMIARQAHMRAGDVKRWILNGDRAFDEPKPAAGAPVTPLRPRRTQLHRAAGE